MDSSECIIQHIAGLVTQSLSIHTDQPVQVLTEGKT